MKHRHRMVTMPKVVAGLAWYVECFFLFVPVSFFLSVDDVLLIPDVRI